jgi:hypothetical protein
MSQADMRNERTSVAFGEMLSIRSHQSFFPTSLIAVSNYHILEHLF